MLFNKKILCLGTNSQSTNTLVDALALESINHGLITTSNFVADMPGYYHTTVADIFAGGVVSIADQFDEIILLDQPLEEWSHWKLLLSTYKVLVQLEEQGLPTTFRQNKNIQSIQFMDTLLQENKSFCVYPWLHLLEEYGDVLLCSKSKIPVKKLKDIRDWTTDAEFNVIREKMLAGKKLEHCSGCYQEEALGFNSARIHESMDWAVKQNITSIDSLKKFTSPVYYEVRPGNKCNLQCRMCCPENSDLIEKEFKKINFHYDGYPLIWGNYDHIDVKNLLPGSRVYHTGGEPTIIPSFYEFLERCVALGRTDIEITLNTNAQKVSQKLLDLFSNFKEVNFSISIDGFDRVNDYIRWNSEWQRTIDNTKILRDHGFFISLECIPSLWNITNLHLLYKFYDREFPDSSVFLQQVYWPPDQRLMSVFNHPNPQLVVESLTQVTQTEIYYADARGGKSIIDTLLEHYKNNPKPDLYWLKKFFEFNDMLDQSRNCRLEDYIPELAESRKIYNI